MQTLTSVELMDEIRRSDGKLAIFLGAGASVSSGIPTAEQLVQDWQQKRWERDCEQGDTRDFEKWKEADGGKYKKWMQDNGHDVEQLDRHYAYTFGELEHTTLQRQKRIAELCEGHNPSIGYYALAHLIDSEVVGLVITTNFDDLLVDACMDLGTRRLLVSSHSDTAQLIRLTDSRPKIIKLHGDYLFQDLQNTNEETKLLKSGMKEKFKSVLQEFGLVFIGYGGNDDSVMSVLESVKPQNIFWCAQSSSSQPNGRAKAFLDSVNGYLTNIDDFDSFMLELFRSYQIEPAAIVNKREARQQHVTDIVNQLTASGSAAELNAGSDRLQKFWSLIAQGDELRKQKDLDTAKTSYLEAISLEPDHSFGHLGLARALDYENDWNGAETAYRKAIELSPQTLLSYAALARVLQMKKDYDGAEYVCRKALSIDPNSPYIITRLGDVLRFRGNLEEAKSKYEEALAIDPEFLYGLTSLANLLVVLGDFQRAVDTCHKMITINPGYRFAYSILALALTELGDLEGASLADKTLNELVNREGSS